MIVLNSKLLVITRGYFVAGRWYVDLHFRYSDPRGAPDGFEHGILPILKGWEHDLRSEFAIAICLCVCLQNHHAWKSCQLAIVGQTHMVN